MRFKWDKVIPWNETREKITFFFNPYPSSPRPESDNVAWKIPLRKIVQGNSFLGGQTVIFESPKTWSEKSTPSEEKTKYGPRKGTKGDGVWYLWRSLNKLFQLEQINTVNICPVFLAQTLFYLFPQQAHSPTKLPLKSSILSFYCLIDHPLVFTAPFHSQIYARFQW